VEEAEVGRYLRGVPKVIPPELPLREVQQRMYEARITALFVVDGDGRVEGLIHIHHLNF
jgi:CBS domain-containing protein